MINKNSDIYRLRITPCILSVGRSFLLIALLLFLTSCSTFKKMEEAGYIWLPPEDKGVETIAEESEPIEQKEIVAETPEDEGVETIAEENEPIEQKEIVAETIENQKTKVTPRKPERPALKKPGFIPLAEELSPLKTQIVSISARNTPLRDVLHVTADAAGLNLVIGKSVDPETLITLTLKNVSVEDALDTIFTSVDYFYSIKGNMLSVKAMDTRIFEFGRPSIIQEYTVDVGGDILGGAIAATETTGGTSGTAKLVGSVTQKIKADDNSFTKFWESVGETIKNLIGAGAEAQSTAEGESQIQPEIQPTFNINQMTGTIVVTATKNALERVDRFLTTLQNILNKQVLIEARIVEVQLTESMKYGIDWTLLDDWLGIGTIELGAEQFSTILGTTDPKLKLAVTGGDFTSLLNALRKQGEVRTLSNPRINIMNGQTAMLSVGRTESYISKVETTTTTSGTTTTSTFTVDTSSVLSGIIIGIVPYIDKKGDITLTITPIISDLYQLTDKTVGTVGTNTIEISLPTVDLKELSTTTKLKNNEMVVIGGLITKEDKLDDSEVPVLARIPFLGSLFKRHSKTEETKELVIMLRPTLTTN